MTIRRTAAALIFAGVVFAGVVFAAGASLAQEPGWSTAMLPTSPEARQIRQMDILDRPYRPGHVYGNTVRRMYYRGHPFPVPLRRSQSVFRRW